MESLIRIVQSKRPLSSFFSVVPTFVPTVSAEGSTVGCLLYTSVEHIEQGRVLENADALDANDLGGEDLNGLVRAVVVHIGVDLSLIHISMIGVFIDTFVVLTLNALVIICTLYTADGPLANGYVGDVTSVLSKTNLAQTAFGTVMGASLGAKFVAVCLFFFAFSTVLSWNLFGKINAIWLFGRKNPKVCSVVYTVIALVFILLGTMMSNDLVWELTDMFNNLMVIPNVIALFALTKMVVDHSKAKAL